MTTAGERIVVNSIERRLGELDYFSYLWKCALGGEIAYVICLFGAFFVGRTGAGEQVHRAMFETIPGFVWLTPASVVLGAVGVFFFSLIVGAYMVWMHNTSIKS